MSVSIHGTNGVTFNDGSMQKTSAQTGFRNRIINGDMRIDQRNAGASVTPTNNQYLVDRFAATLTQASKFTAQQNAGAVTPPTGFTNYLGITSSSSYSVLVGDTFAILQYIEGFNTADLAWGTASASTITLSFQVYSSLTGTFGGALTNNAQNRSYPFSYTISSANTWTKITITIAGDTSGTWLSNNSTGIGIRFGLGSGSTYSGTSGAWAAGNFIQPTSTVSVVGTSGATFYITGVQFETALVATDFERRQYGTELALCQRYFETSYPIGTAVGTATEVNSAYHYVMALSGVATTAQIYVPLKATKRAAPTIVMYSGLSGASGKVFEYNGASDRAALSQFIGTNSFVGYSASLTGSNNINFGFQWTASSEL